MFGILFMPVCMLNLPWKLLEPAAEEATPLMQLTLNHGSVKHPQDKTLVIGIDVRYGTLWLCEPVSLTMRN
jgi:hypothetical protein